MKRALRTAMMALLAVVLCFGMLAPTANAATSTAFDVSVPIKINVTGSQPVEGAFAQFTIKALTADAPMPDDAKGTELVWNVPIKDKGENIYNLDIVFPRPGVYEYTIQMTDGTYYDARRDETLYTMKVFNLTNDDEDCVLITTGSDNTKYDSLNYRVLLTNLTVTKKWIDQASSRPYSVEIGVYYEDDGDEVTLKTMDFAKGVSDEYTFPAAKLSSGNSWQSTWTGLNARFDYKVKETKVPAGYVASYKYADGIWYVTNTGALLQTGQLNWPIPVLCAGGFLLLTLGILLMLRKKEDNNG